MIPAPRPEDRTTLDRVAATLMAPAHATTAARAEVATRWRERLATDAATELGHRPAPARRRGRRT